MNFTDAETPYTRIIEHKHFEINESSVTWITKEYPIEYIPNLTEAYYPVNDHLNNSIYDKYKQLSDLEGKVIFGGRLGQYKYYDMHQVIKSAFDLLSKLTS